MYDFEGPPTPSQVGMQRVWDSWPESSNIHPDWHTGVSARGKKPSPEFQQLWEKVVGPYVEEVPEFIGSGVDSYTYGIGPDHVVKVGRGDALPPGSGVDVPGVAFVREYGVTPIPNSRPVNPYAGAPQTPPLRMEVHPRLTPLSNLLEDLERKMDLAQAGAPPRFGPEYVEYQALHSHLTDKEIELYNSPLSPSEKLALEDEIADLTNKVEEARSKWERSQYTPEAWGYKTQIEDLRSKKYQWMRDFEKTGFSAIDTHEGNFGVDKDGNLHLIDLGGGKTGPAVLPNGWTAAGGSNLMQRTHRPATQLVPLNSSVQANPSQFPGVARNTFAVSNPGNPVNPMASGPDANADAIARRIFESGGTFTNDPDIRRLRRRSRFNIPSGGARVAVTHQGVVPVPLPPARSPAGPPPPPARMAQMTHLLSMFSDDDIRAMLTHDPSQYHPDDWARFNEEALKRGITVSNAPRSQPSPTISSKVPTSSVDINRMLLDMDTNRLKEEVNQNTWHPHDKAILQDELEMRKMGLRRRGQPLFPELGPRTLDANRTSHLQRVRIDPFLPESFGGVIDAELALRRGMGQAIRRQQFARRWGPWAAAAAAGAGLATYLGMNQP